MDKILLIDKLAEILTLVERDATEIRFVGDEPISDALDDLKTTLQKITGLDDAKMGSMRFDKILSLALENKMNVPDMKTKLWEDSGSDLTEVLEFLDDLRESGVTNMYGAGPYVVDQFDVAPSFANKLVGHWMETFTDRHSE